jgi:uncharacterized membrane protein YgdD (TMEM256/DUF423 family)
MAVGAANLVGGVTACHPVANACVRYVATQASTVRVRRGPLAERDDLRDVATALNVQAARTVALLALNPLLSMEGVPKILGCIFVTGRALFASHRLRAWDLHIFRE